MSMSTYVTKENITLLRDILLYVWRAIVLGCLTNLIFIMINVLSYVGMDLHSEVCLWTLVGLVRTIFDATLFKVNANLKQVWQMSMPEELSMPVQRALRTMISGVMLVQCFTVYVYLATYIVLLYPVFLEERPTLVLPWLLLAATRKLLCELTCLALGLGTCVLLGPAKPPCIKFVIVKLLSITPAFYMWMLVFSYYHALKVASAFKTFTTVLPTKDRDYGLELAVRRRRTKSLLGEEQLRTKIVASLYGEGPRSSNDRRSRPSIIVTSQLDSSPNASNEDISSNADAPTIVSAISKRQSETASYEDWYGIDVVAPRIADRILDQFVLMMLRIGAFNESTDIDPNFELLKSISSQTAVPKSDNQASIQATDDTDTPHFVGSSKGNTASYVREYPQIFMKKAADMTVTAEQLAAAHSRVNENVNTTKSRRRTVSVSPDVKGHHVKRTTSKRSVNSNQNLLLNKQKEEDNQPTTSKEGETQSEPLTPLKTTSDDSDNSVLSIENNKPKVRSKHKIHSVNSKSSKKGLSNGTININDTNNEENKNTNTDKRDK